MTLKQLEAIIATCDEAAIRAALSENGFETKILTLVQIPVGSECVVVAGECVSVKFCVAADDIVALTIECGEAQAGFLDGHQVAQFNGVDEFRS